MRTSPGLILFAAAAILRGQSPAFETVSVKPTDSGYHGSSMRDTAGQATYTGMTAAMLIRMAYGIRDFQLIGGPAWINSTRYDVTARVPAGSHPDFPADPMTATEKQRDTFREQRTAMVRAMLADRFGLTIHRETRDLPVYILTVAKDGPKLKDNGGKVSDASLKPGMMRFNNGIFMGSQVDLGSLVQTLGMISDRSIVDKTALTGKYDMEMKWSPEQGFRAPSESGGALPDGPSLFTAIREQLGLRLDSGKGPVEVVVIDSIQPPTEN